MIGLYLPPLPPNQETFVEYRITVTQHESGIKDGIFYSESKLVNPTIPNPYYNNPFWKGNK